MTHAAPLASPRLTQLHTDLRTGNLAALDTFWHAIVAQGTPLVEPIPDDEAHLLVTFLWRARTPIERVVVIDGPAGAYDLWGNQMLRLGATDLWYKTYRMRADTRTTYQLSPNDALIPLAHMTNWAERTATWQPDPLNPRVFPAGAGPWSCQG